MQKSAAGEVSVFGTDASGKAFFQAARVVSIDGFEVTVEGVQPRLDVSNVGGLRHAGQKARYRVVWVGRDGTPQQGQVGLRGMEPDKDIFALGTYTLGTAAYTAPNLPKIPATGNERRRYPRITCRGDAKFHVKGAGVTDSGILKFLSESGCYIETVATPPPSSHLDLALKVDGLEICMPGEVRGLQPGFGMGIAFGAMSPVQQAGLHDWVSRHCVKRE